jgi:hypothetical protein
MDLACGINLIKHFSAGCRGVVIASLIGTGSLIATDLPPDILSLLNAYNEVWTSPSTNGSPGSMPIGNGDITANVWVENDGDLMMYLGKSDSWSEGTRLLKIGRERIHLFPNPFTSARPSHKHWTSTTVKLTLPPGHPVRRFIFVFGLMRISQ